LLATTKALAERGRTVWRWDYIPHGYRVWHRPTPEQPELFDGQPGQQATTQRTK
jgi:hypothetical protein